MDDTQLLRYSRQILLPEVDVKGQQQLAESKVLIVGLGGLGSPVAMYLCSAGIGHLVLADCDHVELSNLQRQIIHDTQKIGQFKTLSAQSTLKALNPDVQVTVLNECLDQAALNSLVPSVDVVVDGSDNFATRFAINAACVQGGVPLVSGAVLQNQGQVAVFLPTDSRSPCYRCLYDDDEVENLTCSEAGLLAPMVGVIGSFQAVEVIKVLLGLSDTLCGKLLLFDAHTMQWRTLTLPKDPACPVCS
jgi:molybdopterin-synthase adenylyltransferase